MGKPKAKTGLRAVSIKKYLKPFKITSRHTTFNGSVQCALAVHDSYDVSRVAELIALLEQAANSDLICVYCDKPAATWDHLHNNVQNKRFSGYGNRIFNLVPACRTCNEKKGAKHWRAFAKTVAPDMDAVERRLSAVEKRNDAERYPWEMIVKRHAALAAEYDRAQDELWEKIRQLDAIAARIRDAIIADLASRTKHVTAQ
ncbi:MAG TPA: HNH endonuclease [Kofleriaceae bacterium]|nr:HNH endonuclease [Kofleriaceae bacterium]